jgi:DNA-binding transcriptional MocR family regulator
MEAPSYLGALQVFSIAQASIKPVQQLNDGPDLDELEAFFASGKTKLFYAVPDFHNPTGVCWSLEVRKKVAELCKQYHVALVEDAPYRALRFSGESLPLVSSFCPENSLVLHSFSKIATPGIRLGLVNGPKEWLSPMIKVKQASDLHSSVPMQAVLLELLTHPLFQAHLEQICQRYHSQYQTLASALSENLDNRFHFSSIEGGMFIWLILPDLDPMIVAKDAISKGVAVVPSTVFYPGNSVVQPALRLNFSHEHPEMLWEAVRRLASVLL